MAEILLFPEPEHTPNEILCDKNFYNGCGTYTPSHSSECKGCNRRIWTYMNYFNEKAHLGQIVYFEMEGMKYEKGSIVYIGKAGGESDKVCENDEIIVRIPNILGVGGKKSQTKEEAANNYLEEVLNTEDIGIQMLRIYGRKRKCKSPDQYIEQNPDMNDSKSKGKKSKLIHHSSILTSASSKNNNNDYDESRLLFK